MTDAVTPSSGSVEPRPRPVVRRPLAFALERPVVGQTVHGFGALCLPWERRGDFARVLRELREKHDVRGQIQVRADQRPFLEAVIDEVFRRRWLSLRVLLVPAHEDTSGEAGLPVPFLRLLESLVASFEPRPTEFHLRLSRESRVELGKAALTRAQQALGDTVGSETTVRAARVSDGHPIAHLFTELIVEAWERRPVHRDRKALEQRIAQNLGWADLAADTAPGEWKVDIRYLETAATPTVERAPTRAVQLLLPMVD